MIKTTIKGQPQHKTCSLHFVLPGLTEFGNFMGLLAEIWKIAEWNWMAEWNRVNVLWYKHMLLCGMHSLGSHQTYALIYNYGIVM